MQCNLTGADPERVISEIEDIIGLDCTDILRVGTAHSTQEVYRQSEHRRPEWLINRHRL